jgi:hypothetical protein
MKTIVRTAGNIGPFDEIEVQADRLRCFKGSEVQDYPFTVIGPYTISDNPGDAPPPFVNLAELEQSIRAERNQLLTASDWTQVADAPVNQSVWATYRQALRDLPQQIGFPVTIDWPVKP